MKLEHIETRTNGEMKIDEYAIGDYKVKVWTKTWGKIAEVSRMSKERYLPEIYAIGNDDDGLTGFEVQTTSYGSIPLDELRPMIAGLEKAAEVVEILTAELIR